MILNKCQNCKVYTIKNICKKCKKDVISGHYKFVKIRDAKKSTAEHFNKRRITNKNSNEQ